MHTPKEGTRRFRYRVGWFGRIVLQVFEPELHSDPDWGSWRDARLQDISFGRLGPITPHQPTSPSGNSQT